MGQLQHFHREGRGFAATDTQGSHAAFQTVFFQGQGDNPHELYAYADQIWIDLPMARFFRSSPVLELLDFLERLAPFSAPDLILRDEKPRFFKPERSAVS